MPHFMFKAKFSAASVKGLIEHPEDRRKTVEKMMDAAGAKLHSYYMTFGETDAIVIFEAPDAATAGALSMAAASSGGLASIETVALLTTEEAMAAMKKAAPLRAVYKAPGH